MPRFLKWVGLYVAAVAIAWALSLVLPTWGHRVTSLESTDVIEHSETRHVFFWGVLENPVHLRDNASDPKYHCGSNALHEVRVSRNLGHALLAVLTIGCWTPAEVEWRCAAPEEAGGHLGPD